jgi:hypothetical protein
MDRMSSDEPGRWMPAWMALLRGWALVKKARQRHHAWLQQAFGEALDDRDVTGLTRIMGRIRARTTAAD